MRRVVLLIAAAAALALPAVAAASGADVIRDCTDDGRLSKVYTQKELRSALASIPSDVDEYTDCRDVIRSAQLALASGSAHRGGGGSSGGTTGVPGGGSSGGGTGGATGAPTTSPGDFGGFEDVPSDPSAAATPAERAAIERVRDEVVEDDPVQDAGVSLPGPLIAALAVGGLALLVLLALDLRRRVVHRGAH